MREGVRIRRDWIDVRHEFLQNDGRWMAGACAKPGFCRECNRDGERPPLSFIEKAWVAGVDKRHAARIIVAAHMCWPVKLTDDRAAIVGTDFTRLRIAHHLEQLTGQPVDDNAVLAAVTVADLLALVSCDEPA
jgi:hypothetical protein